MSTKTKSRSESRTGARFVPERYVGDHIRIGHMQSGATVRDKIENISYGVGAEFNPCTHSKEITLQQGWDQVGTFRATSWRCVGGSQAAGTKPQWSIVSGHEYNQGEVFWLSWPSKTVRGDMARLENSKLDAYNRLRALRPDPHGNWLQAACELKDSKQTLSGVLQFLNWAKQAIGHKTRIPRKGFAPLRAASRLADVAGAYLWYKFGVEPTVSDVRKFLTELSNGRLKCYGTLRNPKTVAKKGEVMVCRYSNRPSQSQILDEMFGRSRKTDGQGVLHLSRNTRTYATWPFKGLTDAQPSYGRKLYVQRVTSGCYFARVKQDIELSGIDDLKRRWSWNCPSFRTIWELVPFSFLVDWVVDVGSTIERLEKRYCTESFLSYLGPVWVTEKTETITYMPIVSGSAVVSLRSLPSSVYDGGWLNLQWHADYSYYAQKKTTSFTRRQLGAAPAVAVPELAREIKAYQITSGMALLLQAAKAWTDGKVKIPKVIDYGNPVFRDPWLK